MNKLQNFAIWLDGYIEAIGEDGFNVSKTNVVINKLNNLFEHVAEQVEPKGKTLEELGEEHGFSVHQGFPDQYPKDNGGIYRC